MSKGWFIALAACVGLLGASSMAQAVILAPGGNTTLTAPEGSLITPSNVAGADRYDAFTNYSFSSGVGQDANGAWRENVVAGRPGNTLGGLSFEFQFTNVAAATEAVQAFAASGFGGWTTNVTFVPGGAVPPFAASRSAAGAGDGITWLMSGGVNPGQTSMWLVVDTNAPTFQPNFISLDGDGGGTGALAAFGPAAPEPATLTLALVALPLLGGLGYRRLRRGKPAVA